MCFKTEDGYLIKVEVPQFLASVKNDYFSMLKDEEKGGLKMCSQHPLRKKHYKMPHSCALAQPLALLLMPFSIE